MAEHKKNITLTISIIIVIAVLLISIRDEYYLKSTKLEKNQEVIYNRVNTDNKKKVISSSIESDLIIQDLRSKKAVYYGIIEGDGTAEYIFKEIRRNFRIPLEKKIYETEHDILEALKNNEIEFTASLTLPISERGNYAVSKVQNIRGAYLFTKYPLEERTIRDLDVDEIIVGTSLDHKQINRAKQGVKNKYRASFIEIDKNKEDVRKLILNETIHYYLGNILEYKELTKHSDVVVIRELDLFNSSKINLIGQKDLKPFIDNLNEAKNVLALEKMIELFKDEYEYNYRLNLLKDVIAKYNDYTFRFNYKETKPYAYYENSMHKGSIIETLEKTLNRININYTFASDRNINIYRDVINIDINYNENGEIWGNIRKNNIISHTEETVGKNKKSSILLSEKESQEIQFLLDELFDTTKKVSNYNSSGNIMRNEAGVITFNYTVLAKSFYFYILEVLLIVLSIFSILIYDNKRKYNYDYLTDLRNRRTLLKILDKNKNKINMSIAYLDLDNFKKINDNYGHNVGDDVLRFVSRLMRVMEENNSKTTCFRVGGDEFIIIFNHNIMNINYEVKQILNQTILTEEKEEILIEGSYGVLKLKDTDRLGFNEVDILDLVDYAMLKAKEKGKNTYIEVTQKIITQYIKDKDASIKQNIIDKQNKIEPLFSIIKNQQGLERGKIIAEKWLNINIDGKSKYIDIKLFSKRIKHRKEIYAIHKLINEVHKNNILEVDDDIIYIVNTLNVGNFNLLDVDKIYKKTIELEIDRKQIVFIIETNILENKEGYEVVLKLRERGFTIGLYMTDMYLKMGPLLDQFNVKYFLMSSREIIEKGKTIYIGDNEILRGDNKHCLRSATSFINSNQENTLIITMKAEEKNEILKMVKKNLPDNEVLLVETTELAEKNVDINNIQKNGIQ